MFCKWKNKSYKVNTNEAAKQPKEERVVMHPIGKTQAAHKDKLEKIKSQIETNGEVVVERRRQGLRGDFVVNTEEVKSHPKTEEEEELIKEAIKNNEFLKNILKEAEIDKIVDAMSPTEMQAGEVIITQGEDGDRMYVSASGQFEITINEKPHDHFSDNRVFGELAILYNTARFATIKASTDCRVWVLNRNVYKQIMRKTAIAEEAERLEFLKSTSILSKASTVKLNAIAALFHVEFYKPEAVIIKQGDVGDSFFIVKSGSASVSIEGAGEVAVLGRGEYFGEKALLEDERRKATVTAIKPGVECLVLSRVDFNNYLGDLPTFLERDDNVKRKSSIQHQEYLTAKLGDFKVLKTIGVGGFGRVQLVESAGDGKLLALKSLKKHTLVKNGQRDQAYNERGIQIKCNNHFIVNLYRTFQDKKYLYYLMECCMGGDLFGLMFRQRNRCFEEDGAKFIAGCVLEALHYLHTRNVAYLDLKPENVLIDRKGYAKLTDFGNAVYLPNNSRTFVFAGTAEYVAPEIIYERGHDKSADCWAFGVFVYELLVGRTPFRTNDPSFMKTYNLILKGIDVVSFPGRVPKNAEALIKKLCRPNHIRRLGCQKNGFDDVRNHKWYQHFNWSQLQDLTMDSPFVPDLTGGDDTTYFDRFKPDTETPPDYEIWEGF